MFRKRSALRSGKLAKKKRQTLYLKGFAILVLLASSVAGSVYGLSRSEIIIHNISVSGTEALVSGDIRAVAESELAGKYLFLFPKKNILLYPQGGIEAAILDVYKRVKSVEVSRSGLQEVSIQIEERKPFAAWCRKQKEVFEDGVSDDVSNVTESCYFLDDGGYIFAEAPRFTGDVYFRYYGLLEEGSPIGVQYLNKSQFQELSFFLNAAKRLEVHGVSLSTSDADFELTLEGGAKILFGKDQNFTDVYNNLEAALSSDTFKESSFSNVEHIDLRFGNRVFYRFRE